MSSALLRLRADRRLLAGVVVGSLAVLWLVQSAYANAGDGARFLQFTIIGLTAGCVFAVAASGLVLTYTTTGVFNFAHGAVGMIAAFVYFELRVVHGVPTPLAAAAVVLVLGPLAGLVAGLALALLLGPARSPG